VCFVRDNDTQVYCHSCLETAKSPYREFKEKKQKKCLICPTLFIPRYGESTCSSHCKKELVNRNQSIYKEQKETEKAEDDGLTREARRWLNQKKRGTKSAVPFHEQVKRMEYSRVFGKYSEAPLYFKRKGYGK